MSPKVVLISSLRYLWALPTTALGLPVALLSPRWTFHTGVLEVHGGLATFILEKVVPLPGGASAMTLGHVVIGRNAQAHERTREHERIHVRQVERWGPLFIPAYLGFSAYLKLRGRNGYLDNPFEVEAYRNS